MMKHVEFSIIIDKKMTILSSSIPQIVGHNFGEYIQEKGSKFLRIKNGTSVTLNHYVAIPHFEKGLFTLTCVKYDNKYFISGSRDSNEKKIDYSGNIDNYGYWNWLSDTILDTQAGLTTLGAAYLISRDKSIDLLEDINKTIRKNDLVVKLDNQDYLILLRLPVNSRLQVVTMVRKILTRLKNNADSSLQLNTGLTIVETKEAIKFTEDWDSEWKKILTKAHNFALQADETNTSQICFDGELYS